MRSIVYYSRKVNSGRCVCGNKAERKIGKRVVTKKGEKRITEMTCRYCYEFYKGIKC